MPESPPIAQINLVVRDMDATLAFYRRGWTIETPTPEHAVAHLPGGPKVEFDSTGFASTWNSSYSGDSGGTTVLGLTVESRQRVDDLYADLTGHGHDGRQPPYDAFWGARYAIVGDPDGNPLGLMSPSDESRRFWPPSAPPRASSPFTLSPRLAGWDQPPGGRSPTQ